MKRALHYLYLQYQHVRCGQLPHLREHGCLFHSEPPVVPAEEKRASLSPVYFQPRRVHSEAHAR